MYLAPLAKRYFFNSGVIAQLVDGFSAGDWARPPAGEGGNTAHWILGHLAAARRSLVRKLGEDLPEESWESVFDLGSKPESTDGYPAPPALLEDLNESGKLLTTRLEGMSQEDGAQEWGTSFPDGGTTLADGAHFLHFHESYHVGQLGLLRRMCGHAGMV